MSGKNALRNAMAYSTIGMQLAITLLLFLYGGYKLDEHYDSGPWFVVLGTFLGMAAGFYNLLRGMKQLNEYTRKMAERDKDKRIKWM